VPTNHAGGGLLFSSPLLACLHFATRKLHATNNFGQHFNPVLNYIFFKNLLLSAIVALGSQALR